MNLTAANFEVTPLTPADIPAAEAIEQAAYMSSPPGKDYHQELQNQSACYLGLRVNWPARGVSQLVGVAGFWLLADELHVMTIAIDPAWQRYGLGQWLLNALLAAGLQKGAKTATLEVRPSNVAARTLYLQHAFQEVGRRRAYYANGEDALILTLSDLDSPAYKQSLESRQQHLTRQLEKIEVDKSG